MNSNDVPRRATSAPPVPSAPTPPPTPSPAVQRAVRSPRREVRNTLNAITGR